MKILVTISRIIVGALFVFSGLVKAIDPLGLAYKMREFFEVWADDGYMPKLMHWMNDYAVGFSIFMITLEVALGVALLIGWQKKLTVWLLFLLTLFFTFLTAFVLFSGKIRACGCFGDCIPLSPVQTFSKDIILTVLIIILLFGQKHIQSWLKKWMLYTKMIATVVLVLWLQFYVQAHLPLKDCLSYKIGNNIAELRKTPKDATYDKFFYSYVYKKGAEEKEYGMDQLPDSTWTFVKEGSKKLLEKGNGKAALIADFSLSTQSGNDTTEAVLNTEGVYYFLFVRDIPATKHPGWVNEFYAFSKTKKAPCYYISANAAKLDAYLSVPEKNVIPILTLDGTVLKTASRSAATLYKMKGGIVEGKWGCADIEKQLLITN
ncbi:MAG: BT_3928 family protein [Ferruginibacter sp.]